MTRWLTFVSLLVIGATAWAAPQVRQYSGDMDVEAQGQHMTMRLFVDVGRTRTEITMPGMLQGQTPMEMITIARVDEGLVYVLYPADHVYEEKPLDQFGAQLAATSGAEGSEQPVGTETVDGVVCDKYEMKSGNSTVWVWTTQDQGLPVKLVPADGSAVIRFRNVQPGAQPASLFEVPAGYTKGSPMQGLMQSLMPAAGAPNLQELTGGALEGYSEALEKARKATGQR